MIILYMALNKLHYPGELRYAQLFPFSPAGFCSTFHKIDVLNSNAMYHNYFSITSEKICLSKQMAASSCSLCCALNKKLITS